MIELRLQRKKYTSKQVIGTMDVYKDNVFVCCLATLEQEWNNNATSNSCIPKGDYIAQHYSSDKYPNALILEDTQPRTGILIHNGAYHTHTLGCIIVGLAHKDINMDKFLDVLYSKTALALLMNICKDVNIILINIT